MLSAIKNRFKYILWFKVVLIKHVLYFKLGQALDRITEKTVEVV